VFRKRQAKQKKFRVSSESFDSLTVGDIARQTVPQARSILPHWKRCLFIICSDNTMTFKLLRLHVIRLWLKANVSVLTDSRVVCGMYATSLKDNP